MLVAQSHKLNRNENQGKQISKLYNINKVHLFSYKGRYFILLWNPDQKARLRNNRAKLNKNEIRTFHLKFRANQGDFAFDGVKVATTIRA